MVMLMTSLFLAVLMLTGTTANDVTQDLSLPPLSEHLLLLDVTSDASVVDVKESLCGLNVRHRFKVIGESRYIFVMHDNDLEALRQLKFPDGSRVTQYPIEHATDYFKMVGVEGIWEENDVDQSLDDVVLTMGEDSFLFPKNTSTDSFISMMAALGTALQESHGNISIITYFTVAAYPPKLFAFSSEIEDNVLQNTLKDVLDSIGGPANFGRVPKKLVKI